MTRFLNLFSEYRAAVEARIAAESAARVERSRADRLQEQLDARTAEILELHRKMTDGLTQRFLGHRLLSDATLPDGASVENRGVPTRSIHGRLAVNRLQDKFKQDLTAYFNNDTGASTDDSDAA